MNEKYIKLINACLPDQLITALEDKSGLERKNVEYVCLEVIARVFGDGSDLTKVTVLSKLKNVVSGDEIKSVLERLENKYAIKSTDSSKVLEQLLPLLLKRITTLDDSYFETIQKEEVKEEPVQEIKEPTVEDVYKNIEKRAEAQSVPQEEPMRIKTKKPLFKKKEKVIIKETEEKVVDEDNKELSLLEKICMIVVGVALLALIGIVLFLFIKQSI
ncbi:MAG: hypothetical protein Q4F12_02705 [Erysipelotrichaceae bacterium]|nr:hypothetical protein [Erysipelotrichaceae bacterium]